MRIKIKFHTYIWIKTVLYYITKEILEELFKWDMIIDQKT